MLSEMTPQQLVEWRAAIDVVGLDDSWQQAGTICETINHEIAAVKAGFAQEKKIPKDWLRKITDFIPLLRKKDERRASGGAMTPEQFAQSLGAMGHKVK